MLADQTDARVRKLAPALGAEVVGVDLSTELSAEDVATIRSAFADHHVLLVRDQNLTRQDIIRFSLLWGQLGEHVKKGDARDGIPEVHVLTNADENGKPRGVHPEIGSLQFHTDKSYMPNPAMATVLYGVQVPAEGGDTLFANMSMVYDALPEDVKREVDNLHAIHSLEWSRRWAGYPVSKEEMDRAPPVRRPLIRRNPASGRKSIYCGLHAWKIDGWTEDKSRDLIDYLNGFATEARFQYRHKWRKNDLLMWDNRYVLHAATLYDTARDVRMMYRTVIEESSPPNAA
jgi:taurine dioxygenase